MSECLDVRRTGRWRSCYGQRAGKSIRETRQSPAAQRPSRPAYAPISNQGEKPGDERGTIRLKNKVAEPALVDGQANQWPVELAAIHVAILQFA